MKKIISVSILALVCIVAIGLGVSQAQTSMANAVPLTGWAWTSNFGWVSFSSTNATALGGGPYGVYIATTTGSPTIAAMDGYAWSSNIGYISFKPADVTGCPSDPGMVPVDATRPCDPVINLTNGNVTGWARVLSMKNYDSSGWLQLSGTNHVTGSGGVTLNTTTGAFSGYAWDSNTLGWINFDSVIAPPIIINTGPTLSCSVQGFPVSSVTVTPGSTISVVGTINNAQAGTYTSVFNSGIGTQSSTAQPASFTSPAYANATVNPISYSASVTTTGPGITGSLVCPLSVTVNGISGTSTPPTPVSIKASPASESTYTSYLSAAIGTQFDLQWDATSFVGYTCGATVNNPTSNSTISGWVNSVNNSITNAFAASTGSATITGLDTTGVPSGNYNIVLSCSKTVSGVTSNSTKTVTIHAYSSSGGEI